MARPQRMTLFTGATGLIGRFLLRDLLLAGENLCLLVRDSKKQSAAARVDDILGAWELQLGRSLPHPKVVVGEVTESGFGMSSDDRQWVASNCNAVLHNAAILEFHGPDRTGEPWRTNLTGTENLLEVCRDLKLREMHYVSTAYVCGDRAGTIGEDEFDCKQGFRNDYEESKFLAERAVRDFGAQGGVSITGGHNPASWNALKFVRGDFLEFMRDIVNSRACRERGLLARTTLEQLLAEPEAHHTRLLGSKLWHAALLELWLQLNVDAGTRVNA